MIGLYVVFHTLEFLIVIFYVIGCVFVGDYDTSSWHLSFKMSLPLDLTNAWSWLAAWFLEFNIAFSYSLCMTADTTYFMCVCLYISTMCDHFGLLMLSAKQNIEQNQTEDNLQKYQQNHLQALQYLTKAIQIHVQVFE